MGSANHDEVSLEGRCVTDWKTWLLSGLRVERRAREIFSMEMLHLAEMMQIIMRTGLVGRDWPMGYSSYQIENGRGVHVVKLFLREQWREKDSFLDTLTVVHI